MTKQSDAVLRIFLGSLTAIALGLMVWWKFRLGIIRYFDADEMAYLHWAHNVFAGRIPYLDFLSYVPPGFLYVLAPLFWFVGGTSILVAGRIFAFVVFTGIIASVILLFWQVRKSWLALIAGVFLAFVPLPSDKFLEVRPDNLAMLFVLVGMAFHIDAMGYGGKRRSWFWAGVLYTASLLILPKTLPQVAVSLLVTSAWCVWGDGKRFRERGRAVLSFVMGLGIPVVIFGVWITAVVRNFHQLDTIVYSLTKLPLEVNRIGEIFPMQPDLFFYPNSTYYGAGGWNMGIITNHLIWLVGLSVGAIRLVTPFVPNGRKGVWAELLIAGSFVAYIATFIYGYPMRHAQYLIPVAVFVAFYAADLMNILWVAFSDRRVYRMVFAVGFLGCLLFLNHINGSVNGPKLAFTNAEDMYALQYVLATIPRNAYVFDMVGSTIYYKDSYYVSGVPFGQWEQYLSRPLPSLRGALEQTKTKYVYQGRLGRVEGLLPIDSAYIRDQFTPSVNAELLIR